MKETIKELDDRLEELLDTLNNNPTIENLVNLEEELVFYSDVYKDEIGTRPYWKVADIRSRFNEQALDVQIEYNKLHKE